MAKNRNKKKNNGSIANNSIADEAQAMDVADTVATSFVSVGEGALRKVKNGRPMKRSKSVRKMKAVAKALSKSEMSVEKISKSENKLLRTKFAKNLYQ